MTPDCTIYITMNYLSRKWTILLIHQMSKGEEWKRFSEIKATMGDITPKVLTERLRELEDEGLIERRVDSTVSPARSEYRLTPMSLELLDIVHSIKEWALKYKIDNPACALQDCKHCTL